MVKERRKYDESLRAYRDTIAVMDGQYLQGELKGIEKGRAEGRAEGLAKGRSEGLAKGRAEGRAEGLSEVAKAMKAGGIPLEDIARFTQLSIDEIEAL